MNLDRIKAAVTAGLQVCWSNLAYSIQPDSGAASGFSIVYAPGTPKENRIGLTWSDGVTLNGDPDAFFIDYRSLSYVVDDALSEHAVESVLDQECRFVAFQAGSERAWVGVFSYLGGLIGKDEAVELAVDLLLEKNWFADESDTAPALVV